MIDISLTISEVILASILIAIAGAIVKPRAPGRWKKAVLPSVLVGIAVVGAAGTASALTSLNVSGTGNVNVSADWQAISFSPPQTSPPTCSTQSYTETQPNALSWGAIAPGGSATAYLCVKNNDGTRSGIIGNSITCTNPGPCQTGTTIVSVPTGTATYNSGATFLVTITVTISPNEPVGTTFSTSTTLS